MNFQVIETSQLCQQKAIAVVTLLHEDSTREFRDRIDRQIKNLLVASPSANHLSDDSLQTMGACKYGNYPRFFNKRCIGSLQLSIGKSMA